jgi:translation initiation factor IF-2
MDKITVAELATECSVQNQVVLSELKRLGLYVFSPTATIDVSFADTIRKKILSQREAEENRLAEAEKKKEAEAAKKAERAEKADKAEKPEKKPSRSAAGKQAAPSEAAAPAPAARKARKAAPKPVEAKPAEEAPKPSLAPRKGRKHYDREVAGLVDEAVLSKPAEPTASEIAREFFSEIAPSAPVEATPTDEAVAPPQDEMQPAPVQAEEVTPGADVAEPPGTATPEVAAGPHSAPARPHAPAAEHAAPPAEPPRTEAHPPATRVVVAPKAKTKVLMRTTAEKVVTPEVADRLLKLREQRATVIKPVGSPRGLIRKKRPGGSRPEVSARPVAKVVELPRPPASPEDFRPISITEGVTLKELAEKMDIKSKYIIQKLISKGILASINQTLDLDVAKEVCAEFGFRADVISFEQEAEARQEIADRLEDHVTRPPVVTVMGHVDHGKTSLLDAIRETNVTETEAGGITQHIGAYNVRIKERNIVFLDTPGHEAFTLMRARGAQATDIVVLVVAADDGVMPQTVEAIHHAKAANVPIVVALNKIDKPGAQPDRVKQALSDHGLVAEDWGGDIVMVPVSAKKRTNIDLLLEMILLVADLKDLKANPKRQGAGVVLEAKVDKGRGPVATVLVQNGTLKLGDSVVAGAVSGRVRALISDRGQNIASAGPSTPVEILGLQDLPLAGDPFQVFDDAAKARQVAEYRQAKIREKSLRSTARLSLDALYDQMREGTVKELPLIIKCDVQGSVEVLSDVLNKLSTEKVKVRILHSGAGAITETDVLLASASNAIIIGFNVRPERKAQDLAETEGVEIRQYTVIYNVENDIRKAMIGMLEQTTKEKYLGRAEVRDTFKIPKAGTIAGSYVLDGIIRRNSDVRLLRDNVVVHEGKVASLRRFKEDVTEVKAGFECGIGLERYSDIKVGDVLEAFAIEKVQPTSL